MTDEKPQYRHFKTICISIYVEDLKRLDAKVSVLKAKGLRTANRSALIRYALERVNPDDVLLDTMRKERR